MCTLPVSMCVLYLCECVCTVPVPVCYSTCAGEVYSICADVCTVPVPVCHCLCRCVYRTCAICGVLVWVCVYGTCAGVCMFLYGTCVGVSVRYLCWCECTVPVLVWVCVYGTCAGVSVCLQYLCWCVHVFVRYLCWCECVFTVPVPVWVCTVPVPVCMFLYGTCSCMCGCGHHVLALLQMQVFDVFGLHHILLTDRMVLRRHRLTFTDQVQLQIKRSALVSCHEITQNMEHYIKSRCKSNNQHWSVIRYQQRTWRIISNPATSQKISTAQLSWNNTENKYKMFIIQNQTIIHLLSRYNIDNLWWMLELPSWYFKRYIVHIKNSWHCCKQVWLIDWLID